MSIEQVENPQLLSQSHSCVSWSYKVWKHPSTISNLTKDRVCIPPASTAKQSQVAWGRGGRGLLNIWTKIEWALLGGGLLVCKLQSILLPLISLGGCNDTGRATRTQPTPAHTHTYYPHHLRNSLFKEAWNFINWKLPAIPKYREMTEAPNTPLGTWYQTTSEICTSVHSSLHSWDMQMQGASRAMQLKGVYAEQEEHEEFEALWQARCMASRWWAFAMATGTCRKVNGTGKGVGIYQQAALCSVWTHWAEKKAGEGEEGSHTQNPNQLLGTYCTVSLLTAVNRITFKFWIGPEIKQPTTSLWNLTWTGVTLSDFAGVSRNIYIY